MAPANAYVDILLAFQEAYAIHGRYLLWLEAIPREEIGVSPLPENYVGFVQLADSHWNLLGHICHASQFGARDVYCKLRAAPLEAFSELASRAGAALPFSIRRKIPGYPDNTPVDPLNWWLRFLWHVFPPEEIDLAPTEGEEPQVMIAFMDPFQSSIDAIEICKLHTDQARFPPDDLERTMSSAPQISSPVENRPSPDGLAGGRWLWWKNHRSDVPQGVVYRLLDYMWDRNSASYEELVDAEVFESAVAPGTVRSYANKANNALPAGFP